MRELYFRIPAPLRRILVGVVGAAVTLFGLILIVVPGPAFLVIPAGLGILAIEFERPRRWKDQLVRWWQERRARRP